MQALGQALLVTDGRCMALDTHRRVVDGKAVDPEPVEFTFALRDNDATDVQPIHRPIRRGAILPDRNVFTGSQEITMRTETDGVEIRYTLDGSEPTPRSTLYDGPFTIDADATILARAYRPDIESNPIHLSGTDATVPTRAVYRKQAPVEPEQVRGELEPGLSQVYYEGDWRDLFLLLATRSR